MQTPQQIIQLLFAHLVTGSSFLPKAVPYFVEKAVEQFWHWAKVSKPFGCPSSAFWPRVYISAFSAQPGQLFTNVKTS